MAGATTEVAHPTVSVYPDARLAEGSCPAATALLTEAAPRTSASACQGPLRSGRGRPLALPSDGQQNYPAAAHTPRRSRGDGQQRVIKRAIRADVIVIDDSGLQAALGSQDPQARRWPRCAVVYPERHYLRATGKCRRRRPWSLWARCKWSIDGHTPKAASSGPGIC